jgi:PAS domain-containing protein
MGESLRNTQMVSSCGVRGLALPSGGVDAHGGLGDSAFHAVFDSISEALVLLGTGGIIMRVNRRSSEVLHAKGEDLFGTSFAPLLSRPPLQEFQGLCQLALSSADQTAFDGELSTGFPVRLNFRASLAEGTLLLLCLEEGTLVRRAEAKWLQVEAELLSVLDSVQAGVVLVNLSGRLRYSNARFSQYFGLDRGRLQTLETFSDLEALLAPRLRVSEGFAEPWKGFVAGRDQPGHDELEMLRPTRRVLERFARPVLDGDGLRVGWLELADRRRAGCAIARNHPAIERRVGSRITIAKIRLVAACTQIGS